MILRLVEFQTGSRNVSRGFYFLPYAFCGILTDEAPRLYHDYDAGMKTEPSHA